jgi:hypothetical protein
MIGLMFFGAIGLWGVIAIALSLWASKIAGAKWRWLAALVLMPLVFFAPVADEIVAYPEVQVLCETAKDYIYDEQFARGKTIDSFSYILSKETKNIFPNIKIVLEESAVIEYTTKIPVIRSFEMTSSGGFLKFPAGSSGGRISLLLPERCSPGAIKYQQLKSQLQIQSIKKPQ